MSHSVVQVFLVVSGVQETNMFINLCINIDVNIGFFVVNNIGLPVSSTFNHALSQRQPERLGQINLFQCVQILFKSFFLM